MGESPSKVRCAHDPNELADDLASSLLADGDGFRRDGRGPNPTPEQVSATDIPEAAPLVSVSHLTKSYGSRVAVRDVSFALRPGVTGLLGPNGAGKSSLVRCLAGLCGWDDGEVRIGGIDLAKRPGDARGCVGYMPERVSFPPEMRVEAYLRFAAEAQGIRRSDRADALGQVIVRAGLQEVRSRIVANLSKGFRQRVGLAQALLGEPRVLILDEPSAGLDPLNVIEIREVLLSYARSRVVLVSTHILPETRLLCDRVLVMSQGSLVYDGPTGGMAADISKFRLQVSRAGIDHDGPDVDQPGASLLQCTRRDDGYELLVEAKGDRVVGHLVARLNGSGWLVERVEPAGDALEDAFRHAVLGARAGEAADGRGSGA